MLEKEGSQMNNESLDAYSDPRHGFREGGCYSRLGESRLEERGLCASYCFL